jgi:hypothetical protein
MFTCCSSLMPYYEYALAWYILVIICMSSLEVIDDLDVEIWLRSYKCYLWYRLAPEGHRGDGLG